MPWSELISQPLVCNLLERSLKHGRTHHGYLFIGEESETETFALSFAQALNCERSDGDFCGCCESCQWIAKNQHPDIYAIRPESKSRRILISQVRELERSVFLKASRAQTKLAIVHGADRLQSEAQDAFLKTLEEPPPRTVFLLLSEEPQQLKETILSRCLHVSFRPSKNKKKTDFENKVEAWLKEFTAPLSAAESSVIRVYGFVGKVMGLLKEMREERLKEAEQILDNPSLDNLEISQRKRLGEQVTAQAQADYLHGRSRVLRTMLEWYHAQQPNPRVVEILETLSNHLAHNVNESLVWEIAMLELAQGSLRSGNRLEKSSRKDF